MGHLVHGDYWKMQNKRRNRKIGSFDGHIIKKDTGNIVNFIFRTQVCWTKKIRTFSEFRRFLRRIWTSLYIWLFHGDFSSSNIEIRWFPFNFVDNKIESSIYWNNLCYEYLPAFPLCCLILEWFYLGSTKFVQWYLKL